MTTPAHEPEDTAMQAARWRTLDTDIRDAVEKYEAQRAAWMRSTGAEYVRAETEMNRTARDIAGYLALALRVRAP